MLKNKNLSNRPNQLTQCCTQFKSPGVKNLCVLHSHLNDMEIPETKRFIPKGFELGITLSKPIGSMGASMYNILGQY